MSNNLIETYIVEKPWKRPTMCANIVPKFEEFGNYFWVSSSFQLFEVTFYHWVSWVLRHHCLPEVFRDRNVSLATVCQVQLRLCVHSEYSPFWLGYRSLNHHNLVSDISFSSKLESSFVLNATSVSRSHSCFAIQTIDVIQTKYELC